jgi:hypothetical protein
MTVADWWATQAVPRRMLAYLTTRARPLVHNPLT